MYLDDVSIKEEAPPGSCHSIAMSLFAQAPTMPAPILSYEAKWIMTATPCQDFAPPTTLAPQWSAWTSDVTSWLSLHSAEYISYIAQCQPWVAVGNGITSSGCPAPTGRPANPQTVTTTTTLSPGPLKSTTATDTETQLTETASGTTITVLAADSGRRLEPTTFLSLALILACATAQII